MTAPERIFLKEDLETGMLRECLGPDGADFIAIGLDDYAALAAERAGWKDAYDRAQRLRASDLERLAAERDAVEARAARMEEALPRAYALGVYDQQHSAEKLDPAKTYEFHRAALTDTPREGETREGEG